MENNIKSKSSSDIGFYGKEFGYWSVQMESMVGPKKPPEGGSSPDMGCDFEGVVYGDDGGIGLKSVACKVCSRVCLKSINAEKSGNMVVLAGCNCKAEMASLSVELKEESKETCYYGMPVGGGTVYLKIESGSTTSETKSFWLYEGEYKFGW